LSIAQDCARLQNWNNAFGFAIEAVLIRIPPSAENCRQDNRANDSPVVALALLFPLVGYPVIVSHPDSLANHRIRPHQKHRQSPLERS
jgi:hypothetical protein